ncbi:MAG: hypothetical protein U0V70_07335 [Terriglobia bacterium]
MNSSRSARADTNDSLYRWYAGRVYSLSLRPLGDVPAAEKVTAAAFITLARLSHQRSRPTNDETQLMGIKVDMVRRQCGGSVPRSQTPHEVEPLQKRELPGRTLDAQILNPPALEAAIRLLPLNSHFAFVLHDVERFSHGDISAMLEWTISLAKTSLAEARMKLRQLLSNRLQPATAGGHPRQPKTG